MSALFHLRPWLTLNEAATFVSKEGGQKITEPELLRLALDGLLVLSVNLPKPVRATFTPGGWIKDTDGIWDLVMDRTGRLEVESRWYRMRGDYSVSGDCRIGAKVRRGDTECQLPPDAGQTGMTTYGPSALPRSSEIVIRMSELTALAQRLTTTATETAQPADKSIDRPLEQRERVTLLRVIAGLANLSQADLSQPRKFGEAVEAATDSMGIRVSAQTVAKYLKMASDLAAEGSKEMIERGKIAR